MYFHIIIGVLSLHALGIVGAVDGQGATPLLPCVLNHGCVCNHSLVTVNPVDGQTYGTCVSCSSGWSGPFCDALLAPCMNGGVALNASNPLSGCNCSIGWSGSSCETMECLHSVGGYGSSDVAAANGTSNWCDDCEPGWTGVQCRSCLSDSVCRGSGPHAECDDSWLVRGSSKHLECSVTSAPFLRLLGPHRSVQGRVTMDCHSPTPNQPFMSASSVGAAGECSLAFLRQEANQSFQLPFFFCTATNCSVTVAMSKGSVAVDQADLKVFKYISLRRVSVAGQVVLLGCCLVIGLLGITSLSASADQRRKLKRALFFTTAVMIISWFVFVAGAVALMDLTESPVKSHVTYGCEAAHCVCGPDPPPSMHLNPVCSSSTFGEHILPMIKHGMDLSCQSDGSSCIFTPRDVPTKVPLSCRATECVNPVEFPVDPSVYFSGVARTSSEWSPQSRIAVTVVVGSIIAVTIMGVHYWLTHRQEVAHDALFTRLFLGHLSSDPQMQVERASLDVPANSTGVRPRIGRANSITTDASELRSMLHHEDASDSESNSGDDSHDNSLRNSPAPTWNDVVVGSAGDVLSHRHHTSAADYRPILADDTAAGESVSPSEDDSSDEVDGLEVHDGTAHQADTPQNLVGPAQAVAALKAGTHSGTPLSASRFRSLIRTCLATSLRLEVRGLTYSVGSHATDASHPHSPTSMILNDIHFSANSGELVALMGPSGAGKTTLLDLLAMRPKAFGLTSGHVALNGIPIQGPDKERAYRSMVGYVSQEDTLIPSLTVRETILFAARLKLPSAIHGRTIARIVDGVLDALRLNRCADTLVGDGNTIRGVSGGERRRVSIAVEYVANPRILFLDEPTSGLDAVSAQHVMSAVAALSRDTHMRRYVPHYFAFDPVIIFSIHQPSAEIFATFDKVLLLSRGVSVFFGPAADAVSFLSGQLQQQPHDTHAASSGSSAREIVVPDGHRNPADVLMRMEDDITPSLRDTLRVERHLADDLLLRHLSCTSVSQRTMTEATMELSVVTRRFYPHVWRQISLLTERSVAALMGGGIRLVLGHAVVTFLLGILMCVLYHNEPLDLPGSLNRAGSVTFLLLVISLLSLSALDSLISERKLFAVEKENRYYTTMPFFATKVLVDLIPLRIIPVAVLGAVIYFPMGLRVDDGMYLVWFLVLTGLFSANMSLLTYIVGILLGTFGSSALVTVVLVLWNFVFGGLMVQSSTMPAVLQPFRTLSPFFVTFEALLVNELNGQMCSFAPTDATGQPSTVSIPLFCVQYLENLGLDPQRFFNDVLTLGLMFVVQCVAVWVLLDRVKPIR